MIRAAQERESGWRVETWMYEYALLDNDHRELLVYHWQPDAAGPDFPHLHGSESLDAQFDALTRREIELDKRHLAIGQVSLAAVMRMLITEFDIRPLHADWEARLHFAEAH